MPVSRNRKNHSQKAAAYKKLVEDKKKAFEKKMRDMYEKQQHDQMDKQISDGSISNEEVDGLNVDDFILEDDVQIVEPSLVEGVTSPDQL
jgi:acyl-CoA reductase-like NAD-dependent aldehyde dehydrogenase